MTQAPLIGIVAGTTENPMQTVCTTNYIIAVQRAGGCPVILPHLPPEDVATLVSRLDGVVMTGGGDFDPALFGQTAAPGQIRGLDPVREVFELALIREVDARDMPLLGVCRGMQWLNVARGGDLYIDLADAGRNAPLHGAWGRPGHEPAHAVSLTAGSTLREIVGQDALHVNSRHHQAVNQPGRQVRVSAVSEDGITEAIECTDRRFSVGIQWHPEDHAVNDEASARAIFSALVDAARAFAQARTANTQAIAA
jgi:putative glutamine amidotransferase